MKMSTLQHKKQTLSKNISESMVFTDVLERIYNKTRGQHNTAALLTAARQHKGVIVTATKKWAKELNKRDGVDAMHYTDPAIWTYDGPVLMDLPTMFEFCKAMSRLGYAADDLLDFMDKKNID
jgi:hypothetical protein